MEGHGLPCSIFKVLFPAWWHVWSEPKKRIHTFVERRLVEDTKSTNQEYVNQTHWVVNAFI
jgi:spore maturation protein CgeB